MTKRMREIQNEILQLTKDAEGLTVGENKDIAKAQTILGQVDELQKEFETLEKLEKAKKAGVPAEPAGGKQPGAIDAVKKFAAAVRAHFKTMNEGTPADGGYTVPEDIQTMVNRYKEERFSLRSLIDSESVSTNAGRRTYQTRAQHTGFSEVGEGGKIGKKNGPKFKILEYVIKKFAGYMVVTNELLEDSDANITNIIVEWLGEEEIATENAKILAAIAEKEATVLTGIKDIKKAINVTLSAFRGSVKIVTNSDGIQYLDTLEDKNGRPLLSPDPKEPMAMRLSVGARSIPVVEVPNNVLATSEAGAIPFYIGDLHEYMKEFDRKKMTLTVTTEAAAGEVNAFEEDLTLFRAIMRADFRVKDDEAIVRGELTPTA